MIKLVVHCKKDKYDVYIGRPSLWGNPFTIGKDGDREEVVRKYEEWLMNQPELVEKVKSKLRGKVLACWCSPEACHGDVLARVANETSGIPYYVRNIKHFKCARHIVGGYCNGMERDHKVKGVLFSFGVTKEGREENLRRKTRYWKSIVPDKIERLLTC